MNEKEKLNKKEKSKKIWNYILLMGVMLIPFILATINFKDYYGVQPSVQYIVIITGTIIMEFFLVVRMFNRPDINSLNPKTAKLYFSTTVNVMLATFASFGIALSILWGNLYTYALEASGRLKYIANLKGQGLILLFFAVLASAIVLYTFLLPLINQINEKEVEEVEE